VTTENIPHESSENSQRGSLFYHKALLLQGRGSYYFGLSRSDREWMNGVFRGFFISDVTGFFENGCARNPRSARRERLF
jgi:hypothetical protein